MCILPVKKCLTSIHLQVNMCAFQIQEAESHRIGLVQFKLEK